MFCCCCGCCWKGCQHSFPAICSWASSARGPLSWASPPGATWSGGGQTCWLRAQYPWPGMDSGSPRDQSENRLVPPSCSSPHSLASISMGAPHPAVRSLHCTSSFQGERLGTSSPDGGLPFPRRLVDGPLHPSDSNGEITLSLKNHLVWMCSS